MKHFMLWLALCFILVPTLTLAQDNATPIEFSGAVGAIVDDDTIIVNGLVVVITEIDDDITSQLTVGLVVVVSGTLRDGIVTASSITIPPVDEPAVTIEKAISTDGENWNDADAAPGPEVELDEMVYFRLVATNDSSAPLEAPSFTDSLYDVSSCQLPEALAPGESVECVIGPFIPAEGQQQNIATIAGTVDGQAITDFDTAHYFGGQLDDDDEDDSDDDNMAVIIVIEGPVQQIIGNVIVIYNIEIEVDDDDPILTVIQVGDVIRVEGEQLVGGVIVVVNIIFIDIDVVIVGDVVWRDSGECGNPPPPWAPASGWRARCERGEHPGGGRGNDDDDDDD